MKKRIISWILAILNCLSLIITIYGLATYNPIIIAIGIIATLIVSYIINNYIVF